MAEVDTKELDIAGKIIQKCIDDDRTSVNKMVMGKGDNRYFYAPWQQGDPWKPQVMFAAHHRINIIIICLFDSISLA